jgi:hypothetical protein
MYEQRLEERYSSGTQAVLKRYSSGTRDVSDMIRDGRSIAGFSGTLYSREVLLVPGSVSRRSNE